MAGRPAAEEIAHAQAGLLASVAGGTSLADALQAVARSVVELFPGMRACVLQASEDGERVAAVHAAGLPKTFCSALDGWPLDGPDQDPLALALKRGEHVGCSDIRQEASAPRWRELCLAHGIGAFHVEPVPMPASVGHAVVLVCLDDARDLRDDERQFVRFAAATAAIALERATTATELAAGRLAQARLRAITAASSDAIYRVSPDGSRMHQLGGGDFSVDLAQPTDTWLHANVPAEEWQAITDAIARAASSGAPFELEHRVRRSEGGYAWRASRAVPVRDEDGHIVEWLGTASDVTERKIAQEQRRASAEFNRRVLESSADCIKVLDLDARLEFMNEAGLCAMEVEDFGAVRGVPWTDFWKGGDHAKALAALQTARQGSKGHFQGYAPTLKGAPRWWDVVVTPICGADGQPEKLLAVSRDITASKQSEVAANESQRELQALADALPVLVTYVDADLRYRFTNRTYQRWFPERKGSIVGKSVREVVGEEAYALFAPWMERALAGEAVSFEQLLPYRDGPARHLRVEYVPRMTRDGAQGFYGLAYDISEQKRIEAALRDSAAQLTAIFAQAAVGLSQISLDGHLMRVNDELCSMLGRDRQTVLAGSIAEVTHPDDLSTSLANFHAVVETGQTISFDKRYVRPDGTVVPANSSLTRLIDEEGRPHSVLAVTVDLTERKRIEERLRELNATLEARVAERTAERDRAWKNSRDLLRVTDAAGVFRAVNPAWTAILGWTEEELLGHSSLEFIHPEDLESSASALAKAARENLTGFHNRYRHRDGSYRWISWVAAPEGELIYASGRDKTADRARDAQLQAAQEALRHSQKMEAMGQLTGGVAHDFNNLLTPIMGTLDMLQHAGVGGEREQRFIAAALQSSERAKLLVQRLLAFARRQPLQATAVDVPSLIGGMAELIGRASGPQINVVVEAEPDLPPAHADPNQLEMALLNLAVNARDAMPEGGSLRIAAALERVASEHPANLKEGRYIRLSVTDTGVGMDEATLARAVEPFFSTKGIGKGTGLGLSSAHGLASQLGGALVIQSQRGVGTQVDMWLPVSARPVETAGAVAEATAGALHAGSALLVDDEELVRMSTADMLVGLGYVVSECASAEAALALIRAGLRPDVLVTDHLMPGITGTELARQVRREHPDMSILLVSGYAEAEGVAPDLARLTKPFRKDELASSLAALRREKGARGKSGH